MKFWQRFNKNTFRGIAAALVVAAAVMGGTDAALAAGEPVTEEQTKIISASLGQEKDVRAMNPLQQRHYFEQVYATGRNYIKSTFIGIVFYRYGLLSCIDFRDHCVGDQKRVILQ